MGRPVGSSSKKIATPYPLILIEEEDMKSGMPAHPVAERPVERYPLRLLFWESTVACNLECIHCRRLDVAKELVKEELTTQEAFRFIDDLATMGSPILVLSGGEPLYRPDIFEIARYAADTGRVKVALATNGALVDER
ncbi:MAG: radical SAM protein, partial [Planctomycetota bacterium]